MLPVCGSQPGALPHFRQGTCGQTRAYDRIRVLGQWRSRMGMFEGDISADKVNHSPTRFKFRAEFTF